MPADPQNNPKRHCTRCTELENILKLYDAEMNNDFGKPINFISILLYKNNYLQHLYQLMNINTYCLNHRRSQEFVLEAALFRGGGTPDPWMATVSITSRLLGRKIEIWRNFWLKMYFWASWEGLSPPSAPCWLRLWPEYVKHSYTTQRLYMQRFIANFTKLLAEGFISRIYGNV